MSYSFCFPYIISLSCLIFEQKVNYTGRIYDIIASVFIKGPLSSSGFGFTLNPESGENGEGGGGGTKGETKNFGIVDKRKCKREPLCQHYKRSQMDQFSFAIKLNIHVP